MKTRLIDPTLTFATAGTWKRIEAIKNDITERDVAEACGWKDARGTQFGNIFNRLYTLRELEMAEKLKDTIRIVNL